MTSLKVGHHVIHYPAGVRVEVSRAAAAALEGFARGLESEYHPPATPPSPGGTTRAGGWCEAPPGVWAMLKGIEWWPGRKVPWRVTPAAPADTSGYVAPT